MSCAPQHGGTPPFGESLAVAIKARFVVHEPMQSRSFNDVHPAGQQPSPLMQAVTGTPPPHVPFKHVVLVWQALVDLHGAPLFPATGMHDFETSSHWPISHAFACGGQAMGEPSHVPFVHVSLTVQNLPSLHVAPSFAGAFTQPLTGSHLPTLHMSFSTEQSTGVPVHTPSWQVAAVEHLSGVHGCPSFAGVVLHAPPTQAAVPHALCEAGQSVAVRHATQAPIPSHTLPPALEHGVPASRPAAPQHPFVQVFTVQSSTEAGQSEGLVHARAAPHTPPVPPELVPLAVPLPPSPVRGPPLPLVAPQPGVRASVEPTIARTRTTPCPGTKKGRMKLY
jgi:hypothetical protein